MEIDYSTLNKITEQTCYFVHSMAIPVPMEITFQEAEQIQQDAINRYKQDAKFHRQVNTQVNSIYHILKDAKCPKCGRQ